jgi:hypothetical protein
MLETEVEIVRQRCFCDGWFVDEQFDVIDADLREFIGKRADVFLATPERMPAGIVYKD